MNKKQILLCTVALSLSPVVAMATEQVRTEITHKPPIVLTEMGSFMFGGTTRTDDDGDTFHGDHGYAQYFIPADSRKYPVIMWHGGGESGKSWETTADGRDGFWQIFTRDRWPVVIIDQPRRGRAGRTDAVAASSAVPTDHKESMAWNTFRIGPWTPPGKAAVFKGSQFPQDPASVEQFMRWQTPNTGKEPFPDKATRDFMGKTGAQLLHDSGPAILMTHSFSGQYGWATAMAAPGQVRAIVGFEPGEFAFPASDVPSDIPTKMDFVAKANAPQLVPAAQFAELTRMPVLVILGDNISDKASSNFGVELWRVNKLRAQQFVDTVNRHGGHATLLSLPAIGIHGNTHFAFADKNNQQIAGLVTGWLHQQGLDVSDAPYSLRDMH